MGAAVGTVCPLQLKYQLVSCAQTTTLTSVLRSLLLLGPTLPPTHQDLENRLNQERTDRVKLEREFLSLQVCAAVRGLGWCRGASRFAVRHALLLVCLHSRASELAHMFQLSSATSRR
jgi:hypothetical protein